MISKTLLLVFAVFTAAQFVRPTKPVAAPERGPDDLIASLRPPEHVQQILTKACYDCHSNQTHYPWYTEIQPAGWFLVQHIRDGKRALNFSEFGRLPAKRARKKLENCIDEVTGHDMPLTSYTLIHRKARLTEEEIDTFVTWAEAEIRKTDTSLAEY